MLYINGSTVQLTRGDTAYLHIPLKTKTGAYDMLSSDEITFTVKKSVRETNILIQKTLRGTNTFHIEPSDTSSMAFGKYIYDVQLVTSKGDVYTVVPPSTFELLTEVTC